MKMLLFAGVITLASLACSNGTTAKDDTPVRADQVIYDPVASGLTSQNAQTALDELAKGSGTSATRLTALEAAKATAATVSYDGTVAGLVAGTVQGAVDEVAAEQASQSAKQTAMEAAAQGLATALAAVQTDVAALKGVTLDASKVAVAVIPELTVANVQEALATLHAKLTEQTKELDALKAMFAKLKMCPDDMIDIGDSCMEPEPRVGTLWQKAALECYAADRRLCSFDEYEHGCNLSVWTNEAPEWTTDWLDADVALLAAFAVNECYFALGIAAKNNSNLPLHPFRCCTNK